MSNTYLRIGEERIPIEINTKRLSDGINNYVEYELQCKNTTYKGRDLKELVEEIQDDITGMLI